MIPEKEETNKGSTMIVSVLCLKSFQVIVHGGGTQAKSGQLSELKRRKWSSGEAEHLQFAGRVPMQKELHKKKLLKSPEDPHRSSVGYKPVYSRKETRTT